MTPSYDSNSFGRSMPMSGAMCSRARISGLEIVYQPVGRYSWLKRYSCGKSTGVWSKKIGVAPSPRIVRWIPGPRYVNRLCVK
jgi:hypothetical protein